MTNIIVRVPIGEVEDLRVLEASIQSDEEVELIHPFDGLAVAQLFVLLSGAVLPHFKEWLKSRVATRKGFVVIHNGSEFRGYTAEEAERLLEKISEDAT